MGSFDGTCGISNLPIAAGEPVRVVLITAMDYKIEGAYRPRGWQPPDESASWEEQRQRKYTRWRNGWWSQYHHTDVFFPRTLPLRATYDSYGGVENVDWSSVSARIMHDQFKLDLVEYPAGMHDIPPLIAKTLSLEDLLSAVVDDAVTVESHVHEKPRTPPRKAWPKRFWRWLTWRSRPAPEPHSHVPVGLWMVREDVYQALVNCRIAPDYDSPITVAQYRAKVGAFIDDLKETAKRGKARRDYVQGDPELDELLAAVKSMRQMAGNCGPFGSSPPFQNGVGYYTEWLDENAEAGHVDPGNGDVRTVVNDMAEFSMFCTAMYHLRVGWMPRSHGPQFGWTDAHVAVANVVMQVDQQVKERAAS